MQPDPFVQWFHEKNGFFDTSSVGITDFPAHGRGAIALRDIVEGHTIFSIPRELTLSTRTSSLPIKFGKKAWKQFGLDRGWVGLILCMMWEEAQGTSSKWSGYLSTLPSSFDTPMFWGEHELQELQGTAVPGKIGGDEAERDYEQKLLPAIKSRPDLFPAGAAENYSLQRYHIMGSRILSRSFHVEPWSVEDESESDNEAVPEVMEADAVPMDVDAVALPVAPDTGSDGEHQAEAEGEESEDEEDDDTENPADVAMVPMADMLNARFGSENAKLFYEEHDLKMVTTKGIKAGEQIWNTYGDPPNSDLLRRYGHVDVVKLSPPLTGDGNPADIVEIRADLVVSVASASPTDDQQERVDWWLEVADDDTFVIGTDCELPEELVSFVRLLLLPQDEWEKARTKAKLPKPKSDAQILSVIQGVIERRIAEYPTTMQDDEALLAPERIQDLSLNKKHAVIVRLGEKRILHGSLGQVRTMLEKLTASSTGSKQKKRGRDGDGVEPNTRGKKAKK